jgi:hypothetical protein
LLLADLDIVKMISRPAAPRVRGGENLVFFKTLPHATLTHPTWSPAWIAGASNKEVAL